MTYLLLFVPHPYLLTLAGRSVVAAPDRAAARRRLLLRLGMHIILHQVHIGPGGKCRGGENAGDQKSEDRSHDRIFIA
jgi:hypothetical protein